MKANRSHFAALPLLAGLALCAQPSAAAFGDAEGGIAPNAAAKPPRRLPASMDWSAAHEFAPGMRYAHVTLDEPRLMENYIVRVDLRTPGLRVAGTGRAANWGEAMPDVTNRVVLIDTRRMQTRAFLEEHRANGTNMVLAVNTSPWGPWEPPWTHAYARLPRLAVRNGEVVSHSHRRGPMLVVFTNNVAAVTNDLSEADIGAAAVAHPGFGIIMRGGQILSKRRPDRPPALAPRTAFGVSADGRYLYVLVVDGRQKGYSLGADMVDLAMLLRAAGASDAMNADGGGSSTLVYRDDGRTVTANRHDPDRRCYRSVSMNLGFWFEPVIKVEKKPWGADYTLVSSDGTGDVTLVSVRPKCAKYASQMANMYSDDDYGVGVRAWNLRDDMIQANGELKVVVRGGRAGATASVVEGPRDALPGLFAAAGRAHGAAMSGCGGPLALASDGARLSYMFAEVTTESCEDYIELARRGGIGIIHFHDWWSSLGHYPVNTNYFPGGFADLTATAAKVHAAGLKVGMHTLSGCIDFKDPCLATDAVRDLQHVARYTLAEDLAEDAAELAVREPPAAMHDRVMTYSGNGNVLRIGTELVQYDDFSAGPPCVFRGLKRRWLGSRGGAHRAGERVDYLRQRYLSFYPEPGTRLADEVADSIARAFNACKADQIYFDGSEGMGTRFNIDWMRDRLFRGIGRPVYVEASCGGAHNWYFHSRLNAWDYPSWNLNAFNDSHFRLNSSVRKADLLAPQMGWWAPLMASRKARGHIREEMEYCAGKTAALDASFAIAGVEEAFGPPPWLRLEHLTILGWYEGLRMARAFSRDAIGRLSVPGDEYRLRPGDDGAWRLRRVVRSAHRISGEGTDRWTVESAAPRPAALRVEALYGADESGRSVVLLPPGRFPRRAWQYPYLDANDCGAFVFDVKGDGSGRTLVLTVKSPREFTAAESEHRVKVDFTGWRRIALLARERDAAPGRPVAMRYAVYRNGLAMGHISEAFFSWDGGVDAPALEIGEVRAVPLSRPAADHPVVAFGGKAVEIPFRLEAGETAELEGGWWTHNSEQGEPLERRRGPELALGAGATALEWRAPTRAEVAVTAFGDESDAVRPGASLPEYMYELPRLFAPSRGFDAPVRVAVAQGERRQLRLELLGAADRPCVSVAGETVEFPVTMRSGDRLVCRDGREWLLRDAKWHVLAKGTLGRPLPVLERTADVSLTCAAPAAADIRVLVSTCRAAAASAP